MHAPRRKRCGLTWNAAKGMPIASAFMFFLHAHGGSVIAQSGAEPLGHRGRTPSARWIAQVDSPAALATLKFMRKLLSVSPPDVIEYEWNRSGANRAAPIGGFLLAVPSNLPKERAALALQAIKWLTSSKAMRTQVRNGFPVAPRFRVSSDPEMSATSPIVGFVDRLTGRCSDERALKLSQDRIQTLLDSEARANAEP